MSLHRCLGLIATLSALFGLPGVSAWAQVSKSPLPSLSASADAGGPDWAALSAQQRDVLAPLQRDWSGLNAARKAKWLEVAARFPSMPQAEQDRIRQRMAGWAQLTPAERGNARLSFQESKQLSSEEKQLRWEAYQALPAEERNALANRAKPAAERAGAPQRAAAQPRGAAASAAGTPLIKPIAPTLVQAKPGATTTLMTKPPTPPPHQQPGQPTIAAKPGQVDGRTLLPKSGPQAAAASAPRQP